MNSQDIKNFQDAMDLLLIMSKNIRLSEDMRECARMSRLDMMEFYWQQEHIEKKDDSR